MYKGAVGIEALNERLQARLNPSGRPALSGRFRIGDHLIQTRNSHELGLMNGSIVFLRSEDPEEEAILVDTEEGGSLVIPYAETATLRLAYAISVHKAQGCEVPVVVGSATDPTRGCSIAPSSTPRSLAPAAAVCWSGTRRRWRWPYVAMTRRATFRAGGAATEIGAAAAPE